MRAHLSFLTVIVAALGFAQAAGGGDVEAAKKELAKHERAYKAAKTAFDKNPKDAKLKKIFVEKTVAFGTATMTSPALSPREKYPPALRLYREALKHDPTNKEAKNNLKMIEDIYRQMGRPIPK